MLHLLRGSYENYRKSREKYAYHINMKKKVTSLRSSNLCAQGGFLVSSLTSTANRLSFVKPGLQSIKTGLQNIKKANKGPRRSKQPQSIPPLSYTQQLTLRQGRTNIIDMNKLRLINITKLVN